MIKIIFTLRHQRLGRHRVCQVSTILEGPGLALPGCPACPLGRAARPRSRADGSGSLRAPGPCAPCLCPQVLRWRIPILK